MSFEIASCFRSRSSMYLFKYILLFVVGIYAIQGSEESSLTRLVHKAIRQYIEQLPQIQAWLYNHCVLDSPMVISNRRLGEQGQPIKTLETIGRCPQLQWIRIRMLMQQQLQIEHTMQFQKTLKHSIRKCHQRRLEAMCSAKKGLANYAKSPTNQNAVLTTRLLDNLIPSKDVDIKTLTLNSPTFSKIRQHQHSPQVDYRHLLQEVNLNRKQLENAKNHVLRLERQVIGIDQELTQVQIGNQLLHNKNMSLEGVIQEFTKSGKEQQKRIQFLQDKLVQKQRQLKLLQQKIMGLQPESNLEQSQSLILKHEGVLALHSKISAQVCKQQQFAVVQQQLRAEIDRLSLRMVQQNALSKQNTRLQQQNNQLQNIVGQLRLDTRSLQEQVRSLDQAQQERKTYLQQMENKCQGIKLASNSMAGCNNGFELRIKSIELCLQQSLSNEFSLDALTYLEPFIAACIKSLIEKSTVRNNVSVFSLNSLHKILGSYQQIHNRTMLQHDVSHFQQIEETEQVSEPGETQNHQDLLARMQQEVLKMSSSHGVNHTDHSQLKENYAVMKMVNEQMYGQLQSKDKVMQEMQCRVKSLENFEFILEHLKANILSLVKEIRNPGPKVVAILDNVRSFLRI